MMVSLPGSKNGTLFPRKSDDPPEVPPELSFLGESERSGTSGCDDGVKSAGSWAKTVPTTKRNHRWTQMNADVFKTQRPQRYRGHRENGKLFFPLPAALFHFSFLCVLCTSVLSVSLVIIIICVHLCSSVVP